MRCGNRWLVALALVLLSAALLLPSLSAAQTLRIVARLRPEPGQVVDAALLGTDHLLLLYPDAGRIADYTLDGQLHQHILREGGRELRFRPSACVAAPDGNLLVFDEAAHKVFFIGPDGNIFRGVDLAWPAADGQLLALSSVGDLTLGASNVIWATLPERGVLAGFDRDGNHAATLDLAALLPYDPAVYTRAQLLSDGSLFVLEYHQGAVLYRRGSQGAFRRLRLAAPQDGVTVPALQDFAVDDAGRVLLVTHSEQTPLTMLLPSDGGYQSHPVNLDLPGGHRRLACRWSAGMFIVWTRDETEVIVLEFAP
jgi:hypothetical protein